MNHLSMRMRCTRTVGFYGGFDINPFRQHAESLNVLSRVGQIYVEADIKPAVRVQRIRIEIYPQDGPC
jgi:hypothetical protein